MAVIKSRSPYFISVDATDLVQAKLEIYIYEGVQGDSRGGATYKITSTPVRSDDKVQWDISDLIYSEISKSFSSSSTVWVDYQVTRVTRTGVVVDNLVLNSATLGYGYFEDGYNPDYSSGMLTSSTIMYKKSEDYVSIPVLSSKEGVVEFSCDGNLIETQPFSSSTLSTDIIKVLTPANEDSYKERVADDGGTLEASTCLSDFFDEYFDEVINEAKVVYDDESSINYRIENVCEPKYTPIKLTFLNKEGYKEPFWFWKRNDLSLKSNKEEFQRNTRANYSNGDLTTHQNTTFNLNGEESVKMNSGWVDEKCNETFRQMMLSEYVWIEYNEQILPVALSNQSFDYKTRLTSKLINYEVTAKFAFNKINNIR